MSDLKPKNGCAAAHPAQPPPPALIIHCLAARRRRSDEGQSRQYFQAKNPKFSILSYKHFIYLKWKLKLCRIQIHNEQIGFDCKNGNKSVFLIFASKTKLTRYLRKLIPQNCTNKSQKWLCQELLKGLNLKVTKYELIISNQSEMADDYLPGGAPGAPPPPTPIRVNPTSEVQNIENWVFQNAMFPNGANSSLWA